MSRALAALFTATALLVAACGGDDNPVAEPPEEQPLATCGGSIDEVEVTGDHGSEPEVDFDTPLSVSRTACTVLIAGSGLAAEDGDIIRFHYTFHNGRTGDVYGSSYEAGTMASVVLNDDLPSGVRSPLVGAQPGSRLLTVIAPGGFSLTGDAASGLERGDTLVFVADIDDVQRTLKRAEGTAVDPVEGLPTVNLAEDGAPTISVPQGQEPPTELVVQPLIVGTGPVVETGQTITVHYHGVLWDSGQEFDSTWDGVTTQFPIGTGGVIAGWDKGLVGQPVGSQVLLVIPPADGYGEDGAPNAGISGTDTLVFVVDILDAR